MDLHDCIFQRRDTRHFTKENVPEKVLLKALDAAHAAPSVGLSEPWRFIVIKSDNIKTKIKNLFNNAHKVAQSDISNHEQLKHYNALKLEAIEDAPVGIAIFCDKDVLSSFTIGTIGNVSTIEWSCACAVQNLWLSLTAQGYGAGWVSILDYLEFTKLFGVPESWQTLGYLCVGKPATNYNGQPMLQKEKWKKRTAKPYIKYV